MSQRTRMRWLAVCLALVLAAALPLSGAADEDEPQGDDEQTELKQPEKGKSADKADAEEAEDEGEDESAWEPTHRGVYLVAHASYAFPTEPSGIEDDAQHAAGFGALPLNSHVEDSWGFGVRLGYRVIDRLALEGHFEFLNDISIEQHLQTDGSDNSTIARFLTATGNAKGYLLTGRIQPYVLAGIGYGYSDVDPQGGNGGTDDRSSGFVARFGAGTDFYVSETVGLMGEVGYVLPTGDISDFDYVVISAGALLRF